MTTYFDDQVLVPKYSPDSKLLACWFDDDSQIHSFNFGLRIWDAADLTAKYQKHWIYTYAARHEGWTGDEALLNSWEMGVALDNPLRCKNLRLFNVFAKSLFQAS